MRVDRVLRVFALPWPRDPDRSADLERAVSFLDWRVGPATVVQAGYGLALTVGLLVLPLAVLAPLPTTGLVPVVVLAVSLGMAHTVHQIPLVLAALRRTRALGDAPGIIARAVLQMRIEPTVESAAMFAASTGHGPLADSLGGHVRAAFGHPDAGLARFGARWGEWFPELRRATSLVVAAARAPPDDRDRTLDRAVEAVMAGTADRMGAFASDLRGPATALYAFGVLLPLALVALLPAATVAGIPVTLPAVVAIYDLCLPFVVAVAGAWLLVRRPVAFPPTRVPHTHPARGSNYWTAIGIGAGAGIGSAGFAWWFVPSWIVVMVATGIGTGTTLLLASRPVVGVRRRVRAAESNLPDALYLVGRRVSGGTAVETAIADVSRELPGPTGEVFATAATVQSRLRVGVEAAFLGDTGALTDLPSTRLESAARLLAAAAREGRPAGGAVMASAEHLSNLAEIEAEARRDLANVTGTLRHTGAVFGPMVGGATVRLAESMTARQLGGTAADGLATGSSTGGVPSGTVMFDPAGLGIAVGVYVLVLAVVLTVLAVGLERGLDRALVAYRTGGALILAATTFTVSYVAAGLLV